MCIINEETKKYLGHIITNHGLSIEDVIELMDWHMDFEGELFDSDDNPVGAWYDNLAFYDDDEIIVGDNDEVIFVNDDEDEDED